MGVRVNTARRIFPWAAGGCLLALGIWGYVVWANSPSHLLNRVQDALRVKDVNALIEMTDPAELDRLHLDSHKVQAILRQTVWASDSAALPRVTLRLRTPPDVYSWEGGVSASGHEINIILLDSPDHGWKLLLGHLLRSTCFWKWGNPAGSTRYRSLARELGIDGLRSPDGTYRSLEEMQRSATDAGIP